MNEHDQAPSPVGSSTAQDDEQALDRFGLVVRNKEGRRVHPFGPEAGVSLREIRELGERRGMVVEGSDV